MARKWNRCSAAPDICRTAWVHRMPTSERRQKTCIKLRPALKICLRVTKKLAAAQNNVLLEPNFRTYGCAEAGMWRMAKYRGSRRPATMTMDRIRQKAVVSGRCEGAFSRCSSPPLSAFFSLELKNAFSGRSVRLRGHIKRREAPRTYSLEVCSDFLGPQKKFHRHDRKTRP